MSTRQTANDACLNPQIESFIRDNEIVTDETWAFLLERAQRVDGQVSLASLFHEFDQLIPDWAPPGHLESPLTDYHRQLITRLAEGHRLHQPCIRVGRFLLLEMLAQGGQARVYRAVEWPQQLPGRKPRFRVVKVGRQGDPRLRLREAEILTSLEHHGCRRVPRLYGVGEQQRRPFIITSYRAGLDLRQHIKRNGPLSVERATVAFRKTLEALQGAHLAGVLHRDMKPSNMIVRLGEETKITLIDWGLGTFTNRPGDDSDSLEASPELSVSTTRVGTFAWMSPEHFECSRSVTAASDVYSSGCILFYMLTGEPPFRGSIPKLAYQHTQADRPSVNATRSRLHPEGPAVPGQLEELVKAMMAITPDDRPTLAACLEQIRSAEHDPHETAPLIVDVKLPAESLESETAILGATADTSTCLPVITVKDFSDTPSMPTLRESSDSSISTSLSQDRFSAVPTRNAPWLVACDFFPSVFASLGNVSRTSWPGILGSERDFQASLHCARQSFDSEESLQRSKGLQRLAYEKEAVGNLDGAIEQWQAAWLLTPWNSTLRRHYLRRLRERKQRSAGHSPTVRRASRGLRGGNMHDTLQSAETQLARDPWSVATLWEEAMALDLLGYWEACHTTIGLLLTAPPFISRDMVPLLAVSARVSALIGHDQQARASLTAVQRVVPELAQTTEFHELAMNVEAQLTTLDLTRKRATLVSAT